MTQPVDIKEISARYTDARKKFEEVYGKYCEQEKFINNMTMTRLELEKEVGSLSENWLESLVSAAGVQTEETGKISVMAGIAKENLERITPAIDEARLKLLDLCYEAATAGVDYRAKHNELAKAAINPLRTELIKEIQNKVELLHGLNLLSSFPAYETDNALSEVIKNIETDNSKAAALEYIRKATDDNNNTLELYPGYVPSEIAIVMQRSPSPAQMAVAKNIPQKKKALAEGGEKCKGFEGY
ncbi:hypothetical protein ACE2PB_000440 [Salmonella enterica]|nr:hypothetical protein [Salmonella enterica subsp. enterica serovar Santiago]EBH8945220.1 hypothetical protein [Salmonella enterica subsp. enterica serovar 6,7:b:-]EJA4990042.1 hypothetical protein [Salmonella enterica]EBH8968529.1 hypothetical protein [Salmonella enterica subsp. enterica serovar Santiago]EJA5046922.1 hypothetical protein [Salmonella enterica]